MYITILIGRLMSIKSITSWLLKKYITLKIIIILYKRILKLKFNLTRLWRVNDSLILR
jgi:hypothetical protein